MQQLVYIDPLSIEQMKVDETIVENGKLVGAINGNIIDGTIRAEEGPDGEVRLYAV